jgi:Mu transposase, C-terminal
VLKAGYWVMVTDCGTDAILGWAYGKTETADLVLKAMRMAVYRGNALPKVIQYDGGKANLSKDVSALMENMKVLGLKSQPYNGKSKYVERTIGLVEDMMHLLPNFVGKNITARSRDSRRNVDDLQQLIKDGNVPNFDAVMAQMKLVIETFNQVVPARLGIARLKAYLKGCTDPVSALQIVAMFWIKRSEMSVFRPSGLKFELGKNTYEYVVESERGVECLDFREMHLGKKFYVRYNPDNMGYVHLYDENDVHVAQANEKYLFSAIPHDGEMATKQKVWENRKVEIKDGLAKRKDLRLKQAELGNAEAGFENVFKEELNAAHEYLEQEGNDFYGNMQEMRYMEEVKEVEQMKAERKNVSLYKTDKAKFMEVVTD